MSDLVNSSSNNNKNGLNQSIPPAFYPYEIENPTYYNLYL